MSFQDKYERGDGQDQRSSYMKPRRDFSDSRGDRGGKFSSRGDSRGGDGYSSGNRGFSGEGNRSFGDRRPRSFSGEGNRSFGDRRPRSFSGEGNRSFGDRRPRSFSGEGNRSFGDRRPSGDSALFKIIDEVQTTHEPVFVGKGNKAVILSAENWRAIQETLHIVSHSEDKEDIIKDKEIDTNECEADIDW